MKINKYQIVVIFWELALFVGYFLTDMFFTNKFAILIIWTVTISLALCVQVILMWYEKKDGYLTHLTWLVVSISGGVATYLKYTGIVNNPILIATMWFFLTVCGMVATAIFQKNKSYYFLAGLYLIATIVFHFTFDNNTQGIIFAGSVFLILGIVDALLEYHPVRGHLADWNLTKEAGSSEIKNEA